jgi:hypothetical protein
LLDIGMTPTLAGFAPAMPDGSPPLKRNYGVVV